MERLLEQNSSTFIQKLDSFIATLTNDFEAKLKTYTTTNNIDVFITNLKHDILELFSVILSFLHNMFTAVIKAGAVATAKASEALQAISGKLVQLFDMLHRALMKLGELGTSIWQYVADKLHTVYSTGQDFVTNHPLIFSLIIASLALFVIYKIIMGRKVKPAAVGEVSIPLSTFEQLNEGVLNQIPGTIKSLIVSIPIISKTIKSELGETLEEITTAGIISIAIATAITGCVTMYYYATH